MNLDKVYVVTNKCVWDDENLSEVVSVATTQELANKSFNKYVKEVKEEFGLNNLDVLSLGLIIDEGIDYFNVFLKGEANSYHVYISILEKDLLKEKELEL